MLFFDDFGAWITVDGEAVEEFKIESDIAQRRVSCYVASVEGKVRFTTLFVQCSRSN
jgi:hypothetical protein